uniref:Uncharacterized protein n=1 Tax=Arundo donax TaxID=35708 RepID=A0A0A8YAZ3_ARUDO
MILFLKRYNHNLICSDIQSNVLNSFFCPSCKRRM